MSYEKYIKYKTKYLNLKAKIHNEKIQLGGGNNNSVDNDFIQTLGSSPNSDIFNKNFNLVGGAKQKSESDVGLPDKLSSSSESSKSKDSKSSESSESSESDKLPNKLSSESSENKNSEKSLKTTETGIDDEIIGGARKLKKKKNVFSESDSELNETESSLLSFSSVESESSSD
jgi:hypothetical protein